MTHLTPIDPHVHLRGQEYGDIDYMGMAQEDATECGLCHLSEMPNPKPWITDAKIVAERLERWRRHGDIHHNVVTRVGLGCHIGLTTDLEQVKAALASAQNRECGLRADKVFYSHSTGKLGLLDDDLQREIWKIKQGMGYTGVSIGHFEDEAKFGSCGVKFDPNDPVSHSLYQNEDAEVSQVNKQLSYASQRGFEGTFYIAHVSSPDTIEMVKTWRRSPLSFKIVIEMTWHHMLLNFYHTRLFKNGNMLKVNPPLRSKRTQEKLLDHVLRGDIDIIATDHAPHPMARKMDPVSPASGVPGLPFWPAGIEIMKYKYGISQRLLDNLIFHNANRIFDLGLVPKMVETTYNLDLWNKYGYNPYCSMFPRGSIHG